MAKLILLVALAFSITTGSITMLVLKSSARDGVPWQQRPLDIGKNKGVGFGRRHLHVIVL